MIWGLVYDCFYPGWWFGTFCIFPYIGNNHPNWLMVFTTSNGDWFMDVYGDWTHFWLVELYHLFGMYFTELKAAKPSHREAAHQVPSLVPPRLPPIIEDVFWWIGINGKKIRFLFLLLVNINIHCQPIEALKWAWKLRRLRSGFGVEGMHW